MLALPCGDVTATFQRAPSVLGLCHGGLEGQSAASGGREEVLCRGVRSRRSGRPGEGSGLRAPG